MPRFGGIPVEQSAPQPRFAGVAVEAPRETTSQVFDLEAVHVRPRPQDDPHFTFPEQPGNGEDLIAWARFKVPELNSASDQQVAYLIRREVYPDIPANQFYRDTGLGQKFGYDTSTADPTEGMSGLEKFTSGAGAALASTPRGLRQALTEGLSSQAGAATIALDKLGARDAAAKLARAVAEPLAKEGERLRRDEDETRRLEAPLMRTGAGLTGNITGHVAQIVAPGGALKLGANVPALAKAAPALTGAARALLPDTVRGAAASGAGMGAVQPVGTGESRGGNVALSGGAGLAGSAIPRAVTGASRFVGNLLPNVREGAQRRAAGEVIEQFALDPAAVRQRLAQNQTLVAGTSPSLAEATEDLGLAGLQKSLANTTRFGANLRELQEANNAARVAAIEREFGGATGAQAEKLAAARDLAARQSLRGIEKAPITSLDGVQRGVNRLMVKNQASKVVREALADVDAELKNVKTVRDAQLVRDHIGNLMSGQIEGKTHAKLATKELATVRDLLDRQMRQDFPQWGEFLRDYKAASRDINQVNIGEALLDKGPNIRAVGDVPVLSPDKFAGAAADLDRVARQATGFRKARAERILTPKQTQVVDEVRRDLERYARVTNRIRPAGSDTMQNALGGNAVQSAVGPVGAAVIEPVSGVAMLGLNAMRKHYGEKVGAIVEEALLNPQMAAEILSELPPKSRRAIVRQVSELLNQSGSAAARGSAPAVE